MNLPVYPGELPLTQPSTLATEAANRRSASGRRGLGLLPTKLGLLLSPVVLIIGLNVEVFYPAHVLAANRVEAFHRQYGDKSKGEDFEVGFLELFKSAAYPETRAFFEGKTVRIWGRYVGEDDRRFTLIRYRMNCCAADAAPLNAIIMVDPDCPERLPWKTLQGKWVEVVGELRYLKVSNSERFVCTLQLKPKDGMSLDSVVKVQDDPTNPYIN